MVLLFVEVDHAGTEGALADVATAVGFVKVDDVGGE